MTPRKISRVALFGCVVALSATAAGPARGADAPAPGRIVSLVPAVTETLFAVGAGPRVVGVSTYCDQPPEARKLPKVGTFSEPVAEAIVALHPDLVLTSPSPGNEAAVRAIERTGVKVAVVQAEGGLAEVRGAILAVAREAGEDEAGRALVSRIDARLADLRHLAEGFPHPKVAVVVGREPLVLAGPGSYLGELVDLTGGTNVAASVGGRWPRVGLEYLVASAPEVIVDLSVSMGEEPGQPGDAASYWKGFSSLPAVASGRVVTDHAAVMLRPGPRLAEAAETLFAALHPGAAEPTGSRPQAPAGTGTIGDGTAK
jgi:iron complex transport system substrate-binding protein